MLVPFNLTILTFTATTLVCDRSLTNTPLLDIIASLTVPPHPGLQCRSRRRSNNKDVLNGAGESQDLLCTDKSSSTTARRWRNSSCKQGRICVQQDREQFFLQRSLPHHRSVVGQEEGQHPPKLHPHCRSPRYIWRFPLD